MYGTTHELKGGLTDNYDCFSLAMVGASAPAMRRRDLVLTAVLFVIAFSACDGEFNASNHGL